MKKEKVFLERRKGEVIKEIPIFCNEYQKQKNKTQCIMSKIQYNLDKHQFYMTLPLGRFWGFHSINIEKSIKNKKRKRI